MESYWQYNADSETTDTAQQRHDPIKAREYNGDDDEKKSSKCSDSKLQKTTIEATHANHRRVGRQRTGIQTTYDFKCGIDRSCVQRDFRERDDSNADDYEDTESFGVPFHEEDVCRNFVANRVAEHQDANNGHGKVDTIGECVCDVDAAVILVGVAHVAVYIWED
jgi:hypothetical protein